MKFTTSWDDGYKSDLKVAKLLEEHGCTGTFYICPQKQKGKMMLSETEIQDLSKRHEVGAHSMTHPWLSHAPLQNAECEIKESKKWVEQTTGKECTMFCYPYGDHNKDIRHIVKESGFHGARTVEPLQFVSSNPFALPTSLLITPFPKRKEFKQLWHLLDPLGPLRTRFPRLLELRIPFKSMSSWLNLANALFTYAFETDQPFFHLWGHSYEVEKYDMWDELEEFLDFVETQSVEHVVNSALIE